MTYTLPVVVFCVFVPRTAEAGQPGKDRGWLRVAALKMGLVRPLVRQAVKLALLTPVALYFSLFVLLQLAAAAWRHGPRALLRSRIRCQPPRCLQDPSLGSHGYVYLPVTPASNHSLATCLWIDLLTDLLMYFIDYLLMYLFIYLFIYLPTLPGFKAELKTYFSDRPSHIIISWMHVHN